MLPGDRLEGQSHDITDLAQEVTSQSGGAVMLAYLAEGEPVTLSITEGGRTSPLDLRTGEPADDPEIAAITGLCHRAG